MHKSDDNALCEIFSELENSKRLSRVGVCTEITLYHLNLRLPNVDILQKE